MSHFGDPAPSETRPGVVPPSFLWLILAGLLAVVPLFPALSRTKWARLAWVSLGAFLLLALQDQVRWQPWVYQYFLALAVWFFLHRRQPEAHAALQRLVIVALRSVGRIVCNCP